MQAKSIDDKVSSVPLNPGRMPGRWLYSSLTKLGILAIAAVMSSGCPEKDEHGHPYDFPPPIENVAPGNYNSNVNNITIDLHVDGSSIVTSDVTDPNNIQVNVTDTSDDSTSTTGSNSNGSTSGADPSSSGSNNTNGSNQSTSNSSTTNTDYESSSGNTSTQNDSYQTNCSGDCNNVRHNKLCLYESDLDMMMCDTLYMSLAPTVATFNLTPVTSNQNAPFNINVEHVYDAFGQRTVIAITDNSQSFTSGNTWSYKMNGTNCQGQQLPTEMLDITYKEGQSWEEMFE